MELKDIFAIHNALGEPCLSEVEACSTLLTVPKRTALVTQGEMCRDFFFNRSGLLRVSHVDNGVEDTICFGAEGDVFTTMHSYFDNRPSPFSLISITDSEVWKIKFQDIDRLSAVYPEIVLWMRNLLLDQLYGFERRYLFFGKDDAETRYLNFISKRNGIMREVPSKYIAQYLKIAPEYLSRIRRRIVGK